MNVVRFWTIDAKEDLLPWLRDVGLVRLNTNDLTITGFECIGDREYAQSWYCRIAREGWERRGKPDEGVGHVRA